LQGDHQADCLVIDHQDGTVFQDLGGVDGCCQALVHIEGLDGQTDPKMRAFLGLAVKAQISAKQFGQFQGVVQSQTNAPKLAVDGLVCFVKALEKRPVNRDTIALAVNRIKRSLMGKTDNEISSQLLGEKVMEELRNIDHVAYVRFASVYRSFEDVSEFHRTIEQIKENESAQHNFFFII
jgi:hypothetical protein